MKYLSNAFSLQMIDLKGGSKIYVEPIKAEEVARMDLVSVIGHADTATVVSDILGKEVACNRQSITLGYGDELIVAQLTGGRLPEGATTLPEGFQLEFLRVRVVPEVIPLDQIGGNK